MNTILVATDFSEPADNAVDYAVQVARQAMAELILFHVYKVNIHASNSLASTSSIDNMMRNNEVKLAELTKKIADDFQIWVRYEIRKDDTIECLKAFVQSNPVDLVVMGIESNLAEYRLFGNTTTAALQLMLFPLLVVPNDIHFNTIRKIKYACETSYLKEECQLDIIKDFVNIFDAELEIFHVLTGNDDEKNKEALEKLMNQKFSTVDHVFRYVSNSKISDGISAGLKESPADLLVMIHHRLGFFESMIKGSNSRSMTISTRVPLLVIPNEGICK